MKAFRIFSATPLSIFVASLLFLASCKSAQKSYERGNYDEAVELAVKRLHNERVKERDVVTLVEAFNYINQQETEQLGRLRLDNRPENWDKIYDLATRIQHRQELVRPLLAWNDSKFYGQLDNLRFTEGVSATVAEARNGASEYRYNIAAQKLDDAKNGNRRLARAAYDDFVSLNKYNDNYRDSRRLAEEARILGINHVYVKIDNESRTLLPEAFERELESVFVRDLNEKWVKYHTYRDNNLRYDYTIMARLTQVAVSPMAERRDHRIEERQIEDGWEYILDARGNVRKDSLGNDMKRTKMTWIRADVYELRLRKEARVVGYLEYIDNRTRETVLSRPLESNALFTDAIVTFNGDRRALRDETCRRLDNRRAIPPTESDLLMLAVDDLKRDTRRTIRDNDHLVMR
jgi:hypothetical protein